MSQDMPKIQEFFQVLDSPPAISPPLNGVHVQRLVGNIRFRGVSFSYTGDLVNNPNLEELDFEVEAGKVLALVGCSGSGKSTTLSLVYRAFDPQSGTITIDGHDIRTLTLSTLRQNIAIVFQETLMLNRSIADNLRIGLTNASDVQLNEAATKAQALSFIEKFANKYETEVGERGR